jgi:hypothetical protein
MPYHYTNLEQEDHAREFWSGVMDRTLQDKDYDTNSTMYDHYEDAAYYEGFSGKEKGPVPLDYSVLSIAILSLGLILFVEISRHTIDHAAHGRPFFKAVLLMVYSECTSSLFVQYQKKDCLLVK